MATAEVNHNEKFEFRVVHDTFAASLLEDEDVELGNYLLGYKELYKFFNLMGKVFGFVASDVKGKIEVLEELRKGEKKDNFSSLKKMIAYETEEKLLTKPDYVSGCRTLLRLHRGLDFIRQFMQKLSEIEDGEKASGVCQEAYNATLAHYHPWIVRKAAVVAMFALPARGAMLQKVCGENEVQHALDVLPKMLEVTQDVYDRTEKCYTQHDLHSLP